MVTHVRVCAAFFPGAVVKLDLLKNLNNSFRSVRGNQRMVEGERVFNIASQERMQSVANAK